MTARPTSSQGTRRSRHGRQDAEGQRSPGSGRVVKRPATCHPSRVSRRSAIEIQRFGSLRLAPIALAEKARSESCRLLNIILADTMILYALYKKHHWLVAGPTFYQLHLLFDKHAEEQNELIDLLAERVQSLGGIAVGDPRHAAELTTIDRPPNGAEDVPAMIHRLLDAHEAIIEKVRDGIDTREERRLGLERPAHGRRPAPERAPDLVRVLARRGHPARRGLSLLPETVVRAAAEGR